MKYLWTPWRMQYISGNKPNEDSNSSDMGGGVVDEAAQEAGLPLMENAGCVFCDRAHLAPEHDRASLILLRAPHNFVILNLYPYNSAHLMVVPYTHTAELYALDAETRDEMMGLVQRMVSAIGAEYRPEGYNIGMNLGKVAGAGVADHLHMHIVPRWAGDTNFMPVVGQTKVMPELLETTYDRLKARLQGMK